MTHSDPNLLKALKLEIGRCESCGATGILWKPTTPLRRCTLEAPNL
jgi:hypothetical protein